MIYGVYGLLHELLCVGCCRRELLHLPIELLSQRRCSSSPTVSVAVQKPHRSSRRCGSSAIANEVAPHSQSPARTSAVATHERPDEALCARASLLAEEEARSWASG